MLLVASNVYPYATVLPVGVVEPVSRLLLVLSFSSFLGDDKGAKHL